MISPNPASDKAVISVLPYSKTNSLVTIYNMQGVAIFHSVLNGGQIQIDVSGYQKGIYLVNVAFEAKVISTKFIIN